MHFWSWQWIQIRLHFCNWEDEVNEAKREKLSVNSEINYCLIRAPHVCVCLWRRRRRRRCRIRRKLCVRPANVPYIPNGYYPQYAAVCSTPYRNYILNKSVLCRLIEIQENVNKSGSKVKQVDQQKSTVSLCELPIHAWTSRVIDIYKRARPEQICVVRRRIWIIRKFE